MALHPWNIAICFVDCLEAPQPTSPPMEHNVCNVVCVSLFAFSKNVKSKKYVLGLFKQDIKMTFIKLSTQDIYLSLHAFRILYFIYLIIYKSIYYKLMYRITTLYIFV